MFRLILKMSERVSFFFDTTTHGQLGWLARIRVKATSSPNRLTTTAWSGMFNGGADFALGLTLKFKSGWSAGTKLTPVEP